MTGYGHAGPWTAYGTVFAAKDSGAAPSAGSGGLLLLHAGSLLWAIVRTTWHGQ